MSSRLAGALLCTLFSSSSKSPSQITCSWWYLDDVAYSTWPSRLVTWAGIFLTSALISSRVTVPSCCCDVRANVLFSTVRSLGMVLPLCAFCFFSGTDGK